MDESTQQIKEYISKLPKPIQQAVLSPEWRKRIGEIGQKYSLHLDQISALEYEVLFVMIGMEPENDLVANIAKELPTSQILAEQLAEEVNTRIFQYIMKSLEEKTAQQERFNTVVIENPVPQTSIPTPEPVKITENTPKTEEVGATHQKITEPPVNLPGEETEEGIKNNDVHISNDTDTSLPSTSIPPVILNSNDSIPSTPITSLADMKLQDIVESKPKAETQAASPQTTPTAYTVDPYREPLE